MSKTYKIYDGNDMIDTTITLMENKGVENAEQKLVEYFGDHDMIKANMDGVPSEEFFKYADVDEKGDVWIHMRAYNLSEMLRRLGIDLSEALNVQKNG